jgi:putative permease
MTKQVLVFGAAVMTTLLALLVFWQFRIVFIYIMVSLALAATVRPLIVDWKRRRLALRWALVLLYVVGVAGIGFLILLFGRYALNDIQQLAQTLSVQGSWKMPPWLEGSSFQNLLMTWLPTPDKLFEAITGEQGQFVLPAMLNFTEGIGTFLSGAFLILFLSIYWSINQIHFERLWLSLLPSEQRKHARGIWRSIEPDLGAYIRSELVQSVLAVFLLSIGYWLLGSPYPALLALLGALAWLIPVVGVVLALLPPLLIGMLTSVPLSFFTATYTLVIILALQLWIEPRLFKRNWDNPIVTLIIMLAMADAFGLLGIVVAPPLSAVCQIIWNLLASDRLASGATVHIMDLNERQEHLRTVISEMETAPPPLVVNSMDRLATLLKKAQPILPVTSPIEASESKLPLP